MIHIRHGGQRTAGATQIVHGGQRTAGATQIVAFTNEELATDGQGSPADVSFES